VVTGVVDCVGERVEFRVGVVVFVVSDDVLRPAPKVAAGGFFVAADIVVAERERPSGSWKYWKANKVSEIISQYQVGPKYV
jgi:hypothetical protein